MFEDMEPVSIRILFARWGTDNRIDYTTGTDSEIIAFKKGGECIALITANPFHATTLEVRTEDLRDGFSGLDVSDIIDPTVEALEKSLREHAPQLFK